VRLKIVFFAKTDKPMPVCAIFPMMLIRSAGLPLAALESLAVHWQTAEEAIWVGQKRWSYAALALQQAFDAALHALPDSPLRTAVYNARKDFFQRQKLPVATFATALSIPGLSPETTALLSGIREIETAGRVLQEARDRYRQLHAQTLHKGYQTLQQLAGNESFQRALLFASHALLEQLPRFCQTPVEKFAKKERQTALAVLQYVTRMATKTSPLSRFTTVSLHTSSETPQTLKPSNPQTLEPSNLQTLKLQTSNPQTSNLFTKAVVTPNVALLEAIYEVLLRQPAFYRSLSLRLNPGIVAVSEDEYNWLFFNGEQESFQQMAATPLLHLLTGFLLNDSRQSTFKNLLNYLESEVEADPEALESFLLELADLGFLEWVLPENGLSTGWCGGLYQYLGFLPAEPVIVQTAVLLQWLRTTARTLPYQPVTDAIAAQRETQVQLRRYFETFGGNMPPVPVEQIFYEDVAHPVSAPLPPEALNELLDQLAERWAGRSEKSLPEHRAALVSFLKQICPEGQAVDFQDFARQFLTARQTTSSRQTGGRDDDFPMLNANDPNPTHQTTSSRQTIGALLQIYREGGQWHAVVNALYPGGGKMFARWLHLFAPDIKGELETWIENQPAHLPPTQNSKLKTQNFPFPWQGYFNANFQPSLTSNALAVPGGRTQAKPGGTTYLFGNLNIENSFSGPLLRDRPSGQVLELGDLGLEAPESRPPAIRLLWQAGVPFVSLQALLPENLWQPLFGDNNIRYRARHTHRQLVLARAAWALEPAVWQEWNDNDPVDFFIKSRQSLSAMGVPRHFFAKFSGEKPQYFDQNSPVLLLLFQKLLQQGSGVLYLTEMLPLPEQIFVEGDGVRAAEFVVEIKI
jgi:hypothetical protein